MQIYWDHFGFREQHGGIAVYAEQMRRGVATHGISPNPVDFAEASSFWPKALISKKPVWLSWLARSWFPEHFDRNAEAVFHGLANFDIPLVSATRFPKVKLFLTVHDIIPLLLPKGSALKVQMEWLMPARLQRADGLICVSEWARQTLLERFSQNVANQRIVVLPHGVDPSERQKRENRPLGDERKI
jgi:glycosyltransferase involved in cell wall biosynthesis